MDRLQDIPAAELAQLEIWPHVSAIELEDPQVPERDGERMATGGTAIRRPMVAL